MTLAPARWTDPTWLDPALAWADEALERHGLHRTTWEQPHIRPWSTALRLGTTGDPVWLKGNGEGTRQEAALLAALAALGLPSTPHPLAVDPAQGLTLLPDGGPTLREATGGRASPEQMTDALVAYAVLQRATEPHVETLLAAGLADLRPERMPAELAALVDWTEQHGVGGHRLSTEDARRLRDVLPAYAGACAELAASGIAPALQHDDLHDANIFARGPVVFDWGDAVVGHPFGTLLATLNSLAHFHRLAPDDPSLLRLVDTVTEPWSDVATTDERRRLVRLAVRTGPLTRALAWRRALAGADEESCATWGDGVDGWLLAVLDDELPLQPPLLG